MGVRLRWILALAGTACRSMTSEPVVEPVSVPACHQEVAATLSPAGTHAADEVVRRLESHDVVLLGEHHGDVAEIDFLVSVLGKVKQPTVLAMELLPQAAQAAINTAIVAEALDPLSWPEVVGDKYWPAPLHVSEYVRVLEAVRDARKRGIDVQLVGLAPSCRLSEKTERKQRETAIRCFKERDARMLDRLRDLRVDMPKHAVLVSAGWRHVSAVQLPGAPRALGTDLPAHWTSQRILLAGTEQPQDPASETGPWRATCGGTPQVLAEAHGRPVLIDSTSTSWTLSECVDTGSMVSKSVAHAFDAVVGLPAGPAPTPWDRYAFAKVPAEDRTAWARTRSVLMDQDWPTGSPEDLELWAKQDTDQLARQQQGRVLACP